MLQKIDYNGSQQNEEVSWNARIHVRAPKSPNKTR